MIKYSFVIPVYNCEKYLEECVASILQQQGHHSMEIILVDDGSKDNSGEIADELALKYEVVHTYHKKNGGAASARNYGIRVAQGAFLLFIDSDDMIAPSLLDQVENQLISSNTDLIIYGMSFDYYRNNALIRKEELSCKHQGTYLIEEILQNYQSYFLDNAFSSSCNKVFSSQVLKENQLFFKESMTLYEDYEFVLRYLKCIKSVTCINQSLYHYRHDLENIHLERRIQDIYKLKENQSYLLETVETYIESPEIYKVSVNLYMQLLMQHLLVTRYNIEQMRSYLLEYIEEPHFQMLLSLGASLGTAEEKLFQSIVTGQFMQIKWEFSKRRWISNMKKQIKRIIIK